MTKEIVSLSIIVPIYKAEPYIERCARSLMEQTMQQGIEFIFINDCTPDSSMIILGKVLDEYPQREKQVRVINNVINKGVTATRIIGIEAAKGEYIGWCDSDDWVETTMYEELIRQVKDKRVDIVVSNFYKDSIYRDTEYIKFNHCTSPQECIEMSWQGYNMPCALWQQIIRKELLKCGIDKITHIDYGEDIYTLWYTYSFASTIAYVDKYLYHYNADNNSSLVHNVIYSIDKWNKHKTNLDKLTSHIYRNNGEKRFHIAINALKYSMVWKYKSAFDNTYDFYYEFPECYMDVNKFLFTPLKPIINRVKTYIVHNIFFIFWIYYHNSFKRQ